MSDQTGDALGQVLALLLTAAASAGGAYQGHGRRITALEHQVHEIGQDVAEIRRATCPPKKEEPTP